MADPDKIWACQAGETQYWCNDKQLYKAKEFVGEYTRTDAHPVTVEMLKRWASLANDTPMTKTYRNHLLSEIRAAIAKMKEPNNDAG